MHGVAQAIINLPSGVLMFLIRLYQIAVSPYLPKSCRFNPSCSAYALQAFQRYPFFKAMYLAIWRVLRCNPFCQGGYDPLP